jgi:hypothetical protein
MAFDLGSAPRPIPPQNPEEPPPPFRRSVVDLLIHVVGCGCLLLIYFLWLGQTAGGLLRALSSG